MRFYWLKIVLGSVGIFAVGYLGIVGVRSASRNVISNGIPIPFDLVGFNVDGIQAGTVNRVTFLRGGEGIPAGLRISVRGTQAGAERLTGCGLLVEDVQRVDAGAEFRCVQGAGGYAEFGTVRIDFGEGGSSEFPLLIPNEVYEGLSSGTTVLNQDVVSQTSTEAVSSSFRAEARRLADSLGAVAGSVPPS